MEKCQIIDLVHLLGKKWTIELLHSLSYKNLTYNEIIRMIDVNPTLISERLKEMIHFRILMKTEIEGKLSYSLTDKGKSLMNCIHKMREWAENCEYKIPDKCKRGDCICNLLTHED